jgi:hypothetical protein
LKAVCRGQHWIHIACVCITLNLQETRKIILSLEKIRKVTPTGKEILKNINLGMYLGAKIGVLGANGAGGWAGCGWCCGCCLAGGSLTVEAVGACG